MHKDKLSKQANKYTDRQTDTLIYSQTNEIRNNISASNGRLSSLTQIEQLTNKQTSKRTNEQNQIIQWRTDFKIQ